jgi:hypothetical protein
MNAGLVRDLLVRRRLLEDDRVDVLRCGVRVPARR